MEKKFSNNNQASLIIRVVIVPSDISKSIRDTRNKQDTTDMVKDQVLHVKGYVRFLNGILERLQHTDLSHIPN